MAGGIRSFIAIELSDALKQALDALRKRLDSPRYDVRWVAARNIHLTLRFLGEISTDEVQAAAQAAARAAALTKPFRISLRGLGAFPSSGSPRVVWVGVEDCPSLQLLAEDLSRELLEARFPPPDHAFRPHLTLGRVKSPKGKEELKRELQQNQGVSLGQQDVAEFLLIRSELRPAGPVYTPLNRFSLGRGDTFP